VVIGHIACAVEERIIVGDASAVHDGTPSPLIYWNAVGAAALYITMACLTITLLTTRDQHARCDELLTQIENKLPFVRLIFNETK
jgi:hypothetical protein